MNDLGIGMERGTGMLAAFQVLTIAGMILLTYLVYQALGPRKGSLIFNRKEKQEWDQQIGNQLGGWLTVSNIFATATSLATVYIFFIGNTYIFGWWAFASIATLLLGGYVTVYLTRYLLRHPGREERHKGDDQAGSVLLAVFWADDADSRSTTTIIKWITIGNLLSILWMDFAVFSDVSSRLIAPGNLTFGLGLLVLCAFAVLYFTLKFGLRGFVFADLFQSPLIVIGTLALFAGAVFVLGRDLASAGGAGSGYAAVFLKMNAALSTPAISPLSGICFAIYCLFLNSFLMLVTPPHWLRLWIFGDRENRLQVPSIAGTCVVWVALICVGALASVTMSMQNGPAAAESNEVVVLFLKKLTEGGSSLFAVAFWIAGMAALFASADVQIYSLWLVNSFDTNSGKLTSDSKVASLPLLYSAVSAIVFTGLYGLVRYYGIPFDRLILVLLPACLTIAPSFVLALRGVRQTPVLPLISFGLYAAVSIAAILDTAHGEEFAVAAPILPLLISVGALFWPRKGATYEQRT